MLSRMTHNASGTENKATAYALSLSGVCKSFGAVRANEDVSLEVERGTIHGIIGENGAGKSTLMNILYGLYLPDRGTIEVKGQQVLMRSSADAIALGIGMVHQHFMLVSTFSVLDNVMLGSEGGFWLEAGRDAMRAKLAALEQRFGLCVETDALVEDLPVGGRQRVEIIKALKSGADILILDEPTGVLTPQETQSLFSVLKDMRARGVTVLLITHKLDEIMAITDKVSIMRRGKVVGHRKTEQTSKQELAELMVGRSVLLSVARGEAKPLDVCLAVEGLGCSSSQGHRELDGVSFTLRAGEILGLAGVSGNGQSALMETLAGMRSVEQGYFTLLGERVDAANPKGPKAMRALDLGHIPEDRHHHGLVLDLSAAENMVLGFQEGRQTGRGTLMDMQALRQHCLTLMQDYDIRPVDPLLFARNFSGGNQQKIVIAREVSAKPRVLLVGQPTRGVDVGAIEFIHKQIIVLRDAGCAILLLSVELDEILSLSNRVMVMNQGQVVGIVEREETDAKALGLMMAGVRTKIPQDDDEVHSKQGQNIYPENKEKA